MFKKSLVAIAVLGATAFSAQAFTIPYNNTTNNAADSAAGWMVNKNFAAVQGELNAQEQNIAANKTQIEKNTTQISQNTNDIHGLQQNMVINRLSK